MWLEGVGQGRMAGDSSVGRGRMCLYGVGQSRTGLDVR